MTPMSASPNAVRDRRGSGGKTVLATRGLSTGSLGAAAYADPRRQSGPSPRRRRPGAPQFPQNSPDRGTA